MIKSDTEKKIFEFKIRLDYLQHLKEVYDKGIVQIRKEIDDLTNELVFRCPHESEAIIFKEKGITYAYGTECRKRLDSV